MCKHKQFILIFGFPFVPNRQEMPKHNVWHAASHNGCIVHQTQRRCVMTAWFSKERVVIVVFISFLPLVSLIYTASQVRSGEVRRSVRNRRFSGAVPQDCLPSGSGRCCSSELIKQCVKYMPLGQFLCVRTRVLGWVSG